MPSPPPASFERSLAALDPEAFVRFVAAVRTAGEGSTVDREGGVLVVRGEGRTRRVLPAAARRGPFRDPGPVGPVDGPVDEVVAQVDSAGARALASREDARYRSPADLRSRIRHGVDPARAERLLDRHLDLPRDDPAATDHGRTVVLVAGLLVVALVASALVPSDSLGPAGTDSRPAGEGAMTAVGVFGGVRTTPAADPGPHPPGLNETGVVDAAALARAHGNAVADGRYRWTVVRRFEGSDPGGNGTTPSLTTYGSERRTYVRRSGPNGTYVRERIRPVDGNGPAVSRAERYVARYLAGTRGDASPVHVGGRPGYSVTVRGAPTRIDGTVSDFVASALVTREGLVVRLDVSFTRSRDGRSHTVALSFEYERLESGATPSGNGTAASTGTATANGTTSRG